MPKIDKININGTLYNLGGDANKIASDNDYASVECLEKRTVFKNYDTYSYPITSSQNINYSGIIDNGHVGAMNWALGAWASAEGEGSIALGPLSTTDEYSKAGMDGLTYKYPRIGLKYTVLGGVSTMDKETPISSAKYAIAIGSNTRTEADNAVGLGYNTHIHPAALRAVAIGSETVNYAPDSITIGTNANTSVNASGSIVIGKNVMTSSPKVINIGYHDSDCWIGDQCAINIGFGTNKCRESSVNIGLDAQTDTWNAVTIGRQAKSNSAACVSIGNDATASGYDGLALGNGPKTKASRGIALGFKATTGYSEFDIAIGSEATTDATDKSSGAGNIAIGRQAKALDQWNCVAIGPFAAASKSGGLAVGNGATVASIDSVAVGLGASIAEGCERGATFGTYATIASNVSYGVAIGPSANVTANYGAVLGYNSKASGYDGAALGHYAQALANYSTAVGSNATASGGYSTAVGSSATASTGYSTAIGHNASCSGGNGGIAIGYYSSTSSSTHGIAIGNSAGTSGGTYAYPIAIGYSAYAKANYAVQLGTGTNSTAYTLQFGSDKIYNRNTHQLFENGTRVYSPNNFPKASASDYGMIKVDIVDGYLCITT